MSTGFRVSGDGGPTCRSLFQALTALLVLSCSTLQVGARPVEVAQAKTAASTAAPEVCTYDFDIIQRVGTSNYDGLPIKILKQTGTEVEFVVGNTWASGTADAIYVTANTEEDGTRTCYAEADVPFRKSTSSSITARCARTGLARVRLFVSDSSSFDSTTDLASIPKRCRDSVDSSGPTVEYMVHLQCTPTCEENTPPIENPFDYERDPIVVSRSCPQVDEEPVVMYGGDWMNGDVLEVGAGGTALCTLVEMNVGVENGVTVYRDLKPIGRSYSGHSWEIAPGDFSTYSFDCTSGSCKIALPAPEAGRSYVLKSYDYGHELTENDIKARFLERASFGPTRAGIEEFSSPEAWVAEQISMTPTSHRAYFRERAVDVFPITSQIGLLHAQPCSSGSRYRNFAMLKTDYESYLEVKPSPFDASKLILTVFKTEKAPVGDIRTVVDGPLWSGKFGRKGVEELREIKIPTDGKKFFIKGARPGAGVGGAFSLEFTKNGSKYNAYAFFGSTPEANPGNPRVQFDANHLSLLDGVLDLPTSSYTGAMTDYFFEPGATEVIQLTSDVAASVCKDESEDLVGFGFFKQSTIAKTTQNGETRYWIHSTTFNLESNQPGALLSDGGKRAVDLTSNPPLEIDENAQETLKTKCSNVPRTFLNEDSCVLTDADACSYDQDADIDGSGKILICGSPNEVANNHSLDIGGRGYGGFNLGPRYMITEKTKLYDEQRRTVFAEIALHAKDQLRQRMAYALSQILVVADDFGCRDCSEHMLAYHDIFMRNAFGNYFDVLKEVTRHPMMAMMLTFINGKSTGRAYIDSGVIQQADENYSREIMQLFSIGVVLLNDDGTLKLDENGEEITVYDNFVISEYAKVYVGFDFQNGRGNMEPDKNQVDPLKVVAKNKDLFPKMGIDNKYVGDGYPLCVDLPDQHYLKKGALFRILGGKSNPDFAPPINWARNKDDPKRVSLDFENSVLASKFCNPTKESCTPSNTLILDTDVACHGDECSIHDPRTIEVAPGLWYEYLRPPCVNHAFYNDAKSIFRIENGGRSQEGSMMCGNPSLSEAGVVCCSLNGKKQQKVRRREEFFSAERVPYATAVARCESKNDGLEPVCPTYPINPAEGCGGDDSVYTCDGKTMYQWTSAACAMSARVSPEGNVAVIHEPSAGNDDVDEWTHKLVGNETKSYFRVDWRSSLSDFLGDDYEANCASNGCYIEPIDGTCECSAVVLEVAAFENDAELISVENLLATATIGAFVPEGASFASVGISGIKKFPNQALSKETIFEVTDSIGRVHYRKNVLSITELGNGLLTFRTPVQFWSLADVTNRDGEYELDATLEHYFYHPNVAPFIGRKLAQRFGFSNPSPRFMTVITNAFRTGSYAGFGSNKYGCLEATIAAILLDRESLDHILDADPIQGQIQGPYLRIIKAMRASEYTTDANNPLIRFQKELIDIVGEEPYKTPTVFSFFEPFYVGIGRVRAANMYAPESQVLNAATSVGTANGMMSLFKYGSSDCFGSFFGTSAITTGRSIDICEIGDDSTNYGNNAYDPSKYGLATSTEIVNDLATLLTSGRLSFANRKIVQEAYDFTLQNPTTDNPAREALINAQQLISLTPEFNGNGLTRTTSTTRAPPIEKGATNVPYKAVIQFMLNGGADSYNILVPKACSATNAEGVPVHEQYLQERGSLAFTEKEFENGYDIGTGGEDQPCETFTIHEELPFIKELYDSGDLIFFANAGVVNSNFMTRDNWDAVTRTRLFGHDTMVKEVKKVDPFNSNAGTGVLGRLAGQLSSVFNSVVNSLSIQDNSLAIMGDPALEIPTSIIGRKGPSKFAVRPKAEDSFDIRAFTERLNAEHDPFSSIFGDLWSEELTRGAYDGDRLTEYFEKDTVVVDEDIWKTEEDEDKIVQSVQTLAKMIQTRVDRNVDRDVLAIEYGGFDHHNEMKVNLAEKLKGVNKNIQRLVNQLKKDGLWESVTIVIASEFGRTISENTSLGSDHGWAGHYMVMGGGMRGGRILGKYPDDLTNGSPLNASRNTRTRFMPSLSWESIWQGIVEWMMDGFDVELTEEKAEEVYNNILPNRDNTIEPIAGMRVRYTMKDLYN